MKKLLLLCLLILACEEKTVPKDTAPNGKSYELIEPALPSITEFLQNIELRQAVEKELALSIETFSEVEKAKVSINQDTTATVKLKLHPGKELSEVKIKGIQHLIASTVDELKTKRVSVCVLDDTGKYLEYCPERKVIRSCGSSCGD
jgi:flagellar biosynthesis/type III secretory pathway M-ring protein FliF/YscJ